MTFNLLDRKSSLLLIHIDKFRDAYAKTIQHHQFKLDAMVVLPDHVHIMITLPPNSDNYAVIVASIAVIEPAELARWEKATADVDEIWLKDAAAKGYDGKKLIEEAKALLKKYAPAK